MARPQAQSAAVEDDVPTASVAVVVVAASSPSTDVEAFVTATPSVVVAVAVAVASFSVAAASKTSLEGAFSRGGEVAHFSPSLPPLSIHLSCPLYFISCC